MGQERWRRAGELFHAARKAVSQPGLRFRVAPPFEKLVAGDAHAGTLLETRVLAGCAIAWEPSARVVPQPAPVGRGIGWVRCTAPTTASSPRCRHQEAALPRGGAWLGLAEPPAHRRHLRVGGVRRRGLPGAGVGGRRAAVRSTARRHGRSARRWPMQPGRPGVRLSRRLPLRTRHRREPPAEC
jgi:hypothetical protein